MFIGHFAVGFGAKTVVPKLSLGTLFIAAQFIDLLWPTFLLLGFEQVRIQPGATQVTPLQFIHYPYTHSLLFVFIWAALVATIYYLLKRQGFNAIMLAVLVISHWLLDLIVHRPDLPLMPGGSIMLGFNVWSSIPLTLLIEGGIFVAGVWLYSRATVAVDPKGQWGLVALVLFLLAIYLANLFGPPPPDVKTIAWAGQLQWLFVVWGYWVDKHRIVSSSGD